MTAKKISSKCATQAICLATISISIILNLQYAESKNRRPTLYQLARGAEIVLIGEVLEARVDGFVVRNREIIKGEILGDQIEVSWSQLRNWEEPRIDFAVGDNFVVFAVLRDGNYDLSFGNYGAIKFKNSEAKLYRDAIKGILAEEDATTPEDGTAVLVQMLEMDNPLAQLSALRIIYREISSKEFIKKPLVEPVWKTTKNGDSVIAGNAILVLNVITEYSTLLPMLIESLGSPHAGVANSANLSLKTITREDFGFDIEAPDDIRAAAIQDWEMWWEENQQSYR